MICINKSLKYELPEKRIALFSSIYLSGAKPQVPELQQNHVNFERFGEEAKSRTLKSAKGYPSLKKRYSRKPNKERIYLLKPKDFESPGEYQKAIAERVRIETAEYDRKYNEIYVHGTFIGVENRCEGEVL